MSAESNSQKVLQEFNQIFGAIMKGDGMTERFQARVLQHFNDVGHRAAFIDNGLMEPRTVMVLEIAPTGHLRPEAESMEVIDDGWDAISPFMDDEGEPLDDEYDTLEFRVLWLLNQYARTKETDNHKDCGLPAHKSLMYSPYHHEKAILLEESGYVATFRFL